MVDELWFFSDDDNAETDDSRDESDDREQSRRLWTGDRDGARVLFDRSRSFGRSRPRCRPSSSRSRTRTVSSQVRGIVADRSRVVCERALAVARLAQALVRLRVEERGRAVCRERVTQVTRSRRRDWIVRSRFDRGTVVTPFSPRERERGRECESFVFFVTHSSVCV